MLERGEEGENVGREGGKAEEGFFQLVKVGLQPAHHLLDGIAELRVESIVVCCRKR
jgi:hypothetical protein